LGLVYSPYLGRYVPYFGPLTVFSFKVTEAETGVPVPNAQCALSDAPLAIGSLEGVGGYTDLNGVCTLEALFPAKYYSVYKAGYVTARGSVPGAQINVSLTPTTVKYYVTVNAGVGGSVEPFGSFQVAANTKITVTATPQTGYILDYWLINNVKSGNTNPLGATIDRDNYSIYAVFKVTEVPPPTNGDGNGVTWPVTRQIHPFSNVKLEPGIMTWAEKSRTITKIDAASLIGGKLNYTINYLSGTLKGITAKIIWNDDVMYEVMPRIGVPVTGTIDLTGLINPSNVVKVGFSQGPFGFNSVTFDVWIIIGYSKEPVIEPDTGTDWLGEWMKEYWWLAAGGIGLAGLYILTRKGQPLIVMTQPYYPPPRERRKEKEEYGGGE
jgi:hypothetical protein